MTNIFILGSGGREHALADAYAKSKKTNNIFVAAGNDLMDFQNKNIKIFSNILSTDFESILKIVKREKVDLIDVAQDDPLALGFVDKFQKQGLQTFGPTKKAAQIEWDKSWARDFMKKYNLPIPFYQSFSNTKNAIDFINRNKEQLFYVKASGLALGKGAIRAEDKKQAIHAINSMKQFGKASETFVIEEGLVGEEFSFFIISDGKNYKIIEAAYDHKTVYNHDKGPNTGGMGCVSPIELMNNSIVKTIETKIIKPFINGMLQEKRPYTGILYLGGMLTKKGIKIIEFNARWGDPEAEVIIPSIQTDYLSIVESSLNQKLNLINIHSDDKIRISIAGCSFGYPNDYSEIKGKEIFGLQEAMNIKGVTIFGAAVKRIGKRFFANGGRIFHLVAQGKDIQEARRNAYEAMSLIHIEGNNLHYRTDIGWRDVERFKK